MKVPYVKAINDALKEEMRRDGKIVVYGEDVAEFGGIFGETRGLLEEFGTPPSRRPPSWPPPWARPSPACGPAWS